ncbi:MAG: hypothetical protein EXR91_10520 [Gemmatimonadetes bacterium]|nr:hypothetical protein [Gemmatimonadota bacterium]
MMHVAIFVVNYRADDHLLRLVESIELAAAASGRTSYEVHVLDNSCKDQQDATDLQAELRNRKHAVALHSTGRNDGYFGVLGLAQSLVPPEADCVIYSNPDVMLADDFFVELERGRTQGGVMAPAIVPVEGGSDQNPQYVDRLNAFKLRYLRAIYARQFTYSAFVTAARIRDRIREMLSRPGPAPDEESPEPRTIYAAHGALFVFRDVGFFLSLPAYPCFLFCEELFVAEEARRRGVRVVYNPCLRVSDVRHASISRLPSRAIRAYMHESVCYILTQYYDDPAGRR